ncbi:Imm21 family immunity protein [Kitasatospora sp. NPDC052896]|uniref:Imm21 family immunity protein n=1 Tax=Kitasatospora sp. NPDC052896 TaxID=3364061 RepID=UPI0037CC3185
MTTSASVEASSTHQARGWVESIGGPLIVVPVSALVEWGGCTGAGMVIGDTDTPDDYDRACEVEGLADVIEVGTADARALVLADEPASSCYLPEHQAVVRWLAADSEADLLTAAGAVIADPATVWEECGTWETDGPAVLMDSVTPGAELDVEYPAGGLPEQAPIPLPAGRWRVRAVHAQTDARTCVGLVQLLPLGL